MRIHGEEARTRAPSSAEALRTAPSPQREPAASHRRLSAPPKPRAPRSRRRPGRATLVLLLRTDEEPAATEASESTGELLVTSPIATPPRATCALRLRTGRSSARRRSTRLTRGVLTVDDGRDLPRTQFRALSTTCAASICAPSTRRSSVARDRAREPRTTLSRRTRRASARAKAWGMEGLRRERHKLARRERLRRGADARAVGNRRALVGSTAWAPPPPRAPRGDAAKDAAKGGKSTHTVGEARSLRAARSVPATRAARQAGAGSAARRARAARRRSREFAAARRAVANGVALPAGDPRGSARSRGDRAACGAATRTTTRR